jgi:DNA-binding CsgD family transcriptional regulator
MGPRGERNNLSKRESEVLRLASTGLTDQQIANVLGIKVSTVTTYWVRIRGKVGQLSRAELIAASVRQKSQDALNELRSENARLKNELGMRQSAELRALQEAEILRASLDLLPTGMLIIGPDGGVASSNKCAESLLGRKSAELKGQCIQDILRSELHSERPTSTLETERACIQYEEFPATVEVQPLGGGARGWRAVLLRPDPEAQ